MLIGQKRFVKHAEQTEKTTAIRRIAVRETSALRCKGDLNDGPQMMDHHCTMVSRGQQGAPIEPHYAKIRHSLGQRMWVFFNLARTETDPCIFKKMFKTATDCVHNPYLVLELDSFCLVPIQKINANISYAPPHPMRDKNPLLCVHVSTTRNVSIVSEIIDS